MLKKIESHKADMRPEQKNQANNDGHDTAEGTANDCLRQVTFEKDKTAEMYNSSEKKTIGQQMKIYEQEISTLENNMFLSSH